MCKYVLLKDNVSVNGCDCYCDCNETGVVCQAVIRRTFVIVPPVPVAVVTVAVGVDGVLSVELWLVILTPAMEAE